ncbi:lipopolysaccharide biosynthesis protein [Aquirufa nivalisilvae]
MLNKSQKHFIYKLLSNIIRIPIAIALQSIFPRLLGPVNYGNYDFLTDSATKFIGFFETGTSTAFYTNLSRNNQNQKLVRFYWIIVVFISSLYFVFVMASFLFKFSKFIWPDQVNIFILLSTVWGIITFFSNTIYKMLDACNLTVSSEKLRMIHLFFSLSLFSLIYYSSIYVGLTYFFIIQILLIFILIIGSWKILKVNSLEVFPKLKLDRSDFVKFKNLFWTFSSPLLLYALFSLIGGVGERLILQKFGGSVQQAHFGISYKIGSFVFLFTSAMIPIMLREFSKLFENNELVEIGRVFFKSIKIFLFLATSLAVLVAFNADFITMILGGKEFKGAILVVALMAFYPIHQTIGQINATLYFSTNRTSNYRNIGLFIIPLGLIISFFMIAPKEYGGLNLGASGLVCQMLALQFLSTNIMLYGNCKFLNIEYAKFLFIQFITIGALLALGFSLKFILDSFKIGLLFRASIFTISLVMILLLIFLLFPKITGINIPWDTLNNKFSIKKKKE